MNLIKYANNNRGSVDARDGYPPKKSGDVELYIVTR